MACVLQMGPGMDEHMVDVTTMEPAGEGDNAIQVLLAASNSTHAPGHGGVGSLQPAIDALGQQYTQHYEQVHHCPYVALHCVLQCQEWIIQYDALLCNMHDL